MEEEQGGKRFAVVAVEMGFATPSQIVEALDVQIMEDLDGGGHRLIGEILVAQGYISDSHVGEVLEQMFRSRN